MQKITITSICLALIGCAGTMQGVVRDTGEKVVFNYEQGISSDTLSALIDGEAFKGKAVMRGASSFSGNAVSSNGESTTIFGNTATGNFVAKLIGQKGSILSCELQYADSHGFTTAGGVGVCKHGDGRTIDVVW